MRQIEKEQSAVLQVTSGRDQVKELADRVVDIITLQLSSQP
jgi:hypothetical protein